MKDRKIVHHMPNRTAYFRSDTKTVQLWLSPNQYGVRNCETWQQAGRMVAATKVSQTLKHSDTPTAEINWIDRSFAKWDQGT